MTRIAGVELGGTKSIAVLDVDGVIVDRRQIATTSPAATLATLVETVAGWDAARPLAALGIASFGPLRLDPRQPDFGTIGGTPKPDWSHVDVRGAFAARIAVPTGFDTDVAGAALAEGHAGAARDCSDYVYLTIGTGVGMGIVAGGRLVHGTSHPEAGHFRVRRVPGDTFAGVCPYHGDCLEGLVGGVALAARTGLTGAAIADDHPVWASVAADIAEAIAALILALAPQRFVIGGGVMMRRQHLLPLVVTRTIANLGSYLPEHDAASLRRMIVAPGLGDDAGPQGAIALGRAALMAV